MKTLTTFVAAILIAAFASCSSDPTVRRSQTIGVIGGAAVGGIIGNNTGLGTAGGMAVGAALGGILGDTAGKTNSMYYNQ